MDKSNPIIPTVLITGFLGAGKTSVINNLLEQYAGRVENLAVMINEFGSIGIDGALVPEGDYYKIELNKGSIFCICMRTDFIQELKTIARDIRPGLLLIEATGIARVDDMYAMMRQDGLAELIRVERNICVVDAVNFHKVEATLEAVRIQAEYAGMFVLNKTDLVTEARLGETERRLRTYNADAPIVRTSFGALRLEDLPDTEETGKQAPEFCSDSPPEDFFSFSIELDKPLDRKKWAALMEDLKSRTLRGKGFLRFPGESVYFEIIGGEYSEKPSPGGTDEDKTSKVVLIRGNMLEDSLAKRIKACTI